MAVDREQSEVKDVGQDPIGSHVLRR